MPDRTPAPRVSVIIPAFNAGRTLDAALRSVFAQTFTDYEVVVVDDGSTDDTADVARSWGDRVTLVGQPNRGPGAARNAGIQASRGSLLAFLDADDGWLPHKLSSQVAYFDRYPETGLLHTAAVTGDPASPPDLVAPERPFAPPRHAFCEIFHIEIDVNTLTVVASRDALLRAGGFDEDRSVHVEDWDLWLRIADAHPVGYLPWPTAIRRPGGLMSAAIEKTFRGQAIVIRKMAAASARTCASSRADARSCLARRWHRLYWELGYARIRDGRRAGAAAAFLRSLRYRPLSAASYLQLARLAGGQRVAACARRLRASLRSSRPAEKTVPALHSVVHDTNYWRLRARLVSRLHDLDDAAARLRNGDRVRVLFDAASPMSFEIFRPVHERMRTDERFEFWFTATGATWKAEELYARVGVTSHVVSASHASLMKVDACINTDFWDMTWLHRRTRRLHLFHGVAGKYGLDAPVELAPTIAIFHRLLFANTDRLHRYVEAGLVAGDGPVPVLVGYPKLDRLVDGTLDPDLIAARLDIDRSRPTVLYAPTWSPYSSLNLMGEAIIRELSAAGLNVIVKLHDRSYDMNKRGSGGVDWTRRLAAFTATAHVRVVSDPDATPCLAVADALVTDHSSIGFEFTLRDRPLVVVDCPQLLARARVTPSKAAALRAAAEVATSPVEVVSGVLRQLEEPSLHSQERQCLAHRFFYRPGTATARAVAAVYDVLGMEAPAHAATTHGQAALASLGHG